MNPSRFSKRTLLAGLAVLVSLTTACSDATGPSVKRRSGYLTSSAAITTGGTVSTDSASTATPTKKPRKKGSEERTSSGYNVTAF